MAAKDLAPHTQNPQQPHRPPSDAGKSATMAGGVTSADSTRLLIPRGNGLCVYGTATGEKVANIGEHRERVTAVARDPSHPNQVGADRSWRVFLPCLLPDMATNSPSAAHARVSFADTYPECPTKTYNAMANTYPGGCCRYTLHRWMAP